MKLFRQLKRDERGVAVIEIAIVLPVLILFIYGIFQVGILYQANAGMQHALGEGARYATLYPTPTDAQIQAKVQAAVFGTKPGTFTVPTPTSSSGFKTLTVTYSQPMNFLFFPGPTVSLTRTKKVYVAPTTT
ncbi:MAG TPA: TadE/TadG family type IV pilus assembly protein [Sphingomicrobium sp.]|nr:TadE/TadG family type IV pilus assembly protein [Sphingomicrobium sp.]